MKYLLMAGAGVGVLAIIVGIILFAPDTSTEESTALETNQPAAEVETTTPQPFGGVGSLTDLQLRGMDIECSISYQPNEYESPIEGTYFVADGKVRGDFLIYSPELGGTVLSSMIIDDTTMYSWSEINGESYGIKMNLSDTATEETASREPVDMSAAVTYDCKPWENVDNTVFEPPRAVLFQDIKAMMNGGMEYGTVYEPEY